MQWNEYSKRCPRLLLQRDRAIDKVYYYNAILKLYSVTRYLLLHHISRSFSLVFFKQNFKRAERFYYACKWNKIEISFYLYTIYVIVAGNFLILWRSWQINQWVSFAQVTLKIYFFGNIYIFSKEEIGRHWSTRSRRALFIFILIARAARRRQKHTSKRKQRRTVWTSGSDRWADAIRSSIRLNRDRVIQSLLPSLLILTPPS